MSDWYSRQFGDRNQFALVFSFGVDPLPVGCAELDATWGGLAIWANGRCLSRSVSEETGVVDEVRWSMAPILRWLVEAAVRALNEEPFPHIPRDDRIVDGADWVNFSEHPPLTLTAAEERGWFLERSQWRATHSLSTSALDVALPNVTFRRLGDFLEVSWDNETWKPPRRGLEFVEKRGLELVPAAVAADTLGDALRSVTDELARRSADPSLLEVAGLARAARVAAADWQWLVHRTTADRIRRERPRLAERLDSHAAAQAGLHVPHTHETLVLRGCRATSARQIDLLLTSTSEAATVPYGDAVGRFVRPVPAPSSRPWRAGYEVALELRDALGWGDAPAPDLESWLSAQRVTVRHPRLPSAIVLAAVRLEGSRAIVATNPVAEPRMKRETALGAGLGHVLMDPVPTAVDGRWEHWPSAARARAFAVMLLLPEDGIKQVLGGKSKIDAADVSRVMRLYRTGPHSTAFHLHNLGFFDDDRRIDILRELAA